MVKNDQILTNDLFLVTKSLKLLRGFGQMHGFLFLGPTLKFVPPTLILVKNDQILTNDLFLVTKSLKLLRGFGQMHGFLFLGPTLKFVPLIQTALDTNIMTKF